MLGEETLNSLSLVCDSVTASHSLLCGCVIVNPYPVPMVKTSPSGCLKLRNPKIFTLYGVVERKPFVHTLLGWVVEQDNYSFLPPMVASLRDCVRPSVAIWLCISPLLLVHSVPLCGSISFLCPCLCDWVKTSYSPSLGCVRSPNSLPEVVWLCESPVCDVWLVHSVFTLQQDNHDPLCVVYTHMGCVVGGREAFTGAQNYFLRVSDFSSHCLLREE